MRFVSTLLLFFIGFESAASFVFSTKLIEAQKHISNLQLAKGKVWIDAERKANPNNYASDFLENYIDFYTVLCSQNLDDYKQFEKNKEQRISRLKLVEPSNPFRLYALSEISLQWAFVSSLFEEYFTTALSFKSAYSYTESNNKKFPAFLGNRKQNGILKALIGTIPDSYKWMANIAGMEGNFEEGMHLLKSYLDDKNSASELQSDIKNAQLLYCLLSFNFKKEKNETWILAEKYTLDFESNLMSNCIRAFVASRSDRNDDAIQTLLKKPSTDDYIKFPYLEYQLGSAKLNRLDADASLYFKKFLLQNKDKALNEYAYLKLSWCAWLKGDTASWRVYIKLASLNAKDKSKKNVTTPSQGSLEKFPQLNLLKARLLCDGGYYAKAEEVLLNKSEEIDKTSIEKIEYNYRLARIYHENNNLSKAIEYYSLCIKMSTSINMAFAPKSCLELGYICQKLNFRQTAKKYFEKVFEYKNYEGRNYMQQKAKAALSKLN